MQPNPLFIRRQTARRSSINRANVRGLNPAFEPTPWPVGSRYCMRSIPLARIISAVPLALTTAANDAAAGPIRLAVATRIQYRPCTDGVRDAQALKKSVNINAARTARDGINLRHLARAKNSLLELFDSLQRR